MLFSCFRLFLVEKDLKTKQALSYGTKNGVALANI